MSSQSQILQSAAVGVGVWWVLRNRDPDFLYSNNRLRLGPYTLELVGLAAALAMFYKGNALLAGMTSGSGQNVGASEEAMEASLGQMFRGQAGVAGAGAMNLGATFSE
jgi:hypothetical protein